MVVTVVRAAIAALLVLPGAAVPAPARAVDDTSPGVPGTPVATEVTETSALLTWRPSTGGAADLRYEVWYLRDGGTGFHNNTQTPSYRLRWLAPDTSYTWLVRATDGRGQSAFTAPVTFRTDPAPLDSEPPSTPGAPVISAVTATTATLSWAASTDNASAPTYLVYAAAESVGTPTVVGGGTEPATQVNLLIPDLRYDFSVVARDVSGNRSAFSAATRGRTAADPQASCRGSAPGATGTSAIVRITNTGPAALAGWSVRFTLPENQRVVSASHSWAQDGREVVLWWSGWSDALNVYETLELMLTLAPGQPVPDPLAAPTGFTLNGVRCTD